MIIYHLSLRAPHTVRSVQLWLFCSSSGCSTSCCSWRKIDVEIFGPANSLQESCGEPSNASPFGSHGGQAEKNQKTIEGGKVLRRTYSVFNGQDTDQA